MRRTFKVWIEIEEFDEDGDAIESDDSENRTLYAEPLDIGDFRNRGEVVKFQQLLHELGQSVFNAGKH